MTDQKVEKCTWLSCKGSMFIHTSVDVFDIKSNKPVPLGIQLLLPFCSKHFLYATEKLCYVARQGGKEWLQAPYEFITIVETVLKTQKFNKNLKTIPDNINEINEHAIGGGSEDEL